MRRAVGHGGHGGGDVGDGAHGETRVRQLQTQGLHCGDIPIDDQYLFIGFGGEHKCPAIRGMNLYSQLTIL